VVVINSTVGLSAITHGTPVKVCGNALYDIKGLTFREPLSEFWQNAQQAKPDRNLFDSFRTHLINHTQLNGSFYKRLPAIVSATGLRWTSRTNPVTIEQPAEVARKAGDAH
jgi:capsular polysaccharide export protein